MYLTIPIFINLKTFAMKNFITIFFLMIGIHCISQSTVNFENVRSLNEINDDHLADAYPWISSDGLRIYYTKEFSDRNELVATERKDYDSDFSVPFIVPTGDVRPTSCWLSENELSVYISDINDLYYLKRTGTSSDFELPIKINLNGAPNYTSLTGPSLNESQDELFISLMEVGEKNWKIARFIRSSERSFLFEKYIELPLDLIPVIGQLTNDGLSFCVSVKDNEGYSKFYRLSRTSFKGDFNLNSFQEVIGLNQYGGLIGQPSISSNMEWLVGVQNSVGWWQDNDLFIAHQDVFTQMDEHSLSLNLKVYPNPSSGSINIVCGEANVRVEIFSVLGRQIDSFTSSSALVNYQIEEEGMYMIHVYTAHGVQTQKVIVSQR
jgi:hypothetical protein